eukprot:2744762-Pleurochrysis_carterae.AAC.1
MIKQGCAACEPGTLLVSPQNMHRTERRSRGNQQWTFSERKWCKLALAVRKSKALDALQAASIPSRALAAFRHLYSIRAMSCGRELSSTGTPISAVGRGDDCNSKRSTNVAGRVM